MWNQQRKQKKSAYNASFFLDGISELYGLESEYAKGGSGIDKNMS